MSRGQQCPQGVSWCPRCTKQTYPYVSGRHHIGDIPPLNLGRVQISQLELVKREDNEQETFLRMHFASQRTIQETSLESKGWSMSVKKDKQLVIWIQSGRTEKTDSNLGIDNTWGSWVGNVIHMRLTFHPPLDHFIRIIQTTHVVCVPTSGFRALVVHETLKACAHSSDEMFSMRFDGQLVRLQWIFR